MTDAVNTCPKCGELTELDANQTKVRSCPWCGDRLRPRSTWVDKDAVRAEVHRVGTNAAASVLGVALSSVSRISTGKRPFPRRLSLSLTLAALALLPDRPRRGYGPRLEHKRDRTAHLMLSADEYGRIKRAAGSGSVSSWLREAALAALEKR